MALLFYMLIELHINVKETRKSNMDNPETLVTRQSDKDKQKCHYTEN